VRISFDIGGTFTDMVLVDDKTGFRWFGKALTTHEDVSRGVGDGIRHLLRTADHETTAITRPIVGATTLITNALVEGRGGPTALVTTRGFADLLEIGRELRYDLYDLRLEFAPPLVPEDARFEVTERILQDGRIETPLAQDELDDLVEALRASGARSVAVCFLHSYANPEHERAAAAVFRQAMPSLRISASSSVAPEIREVERLNTTVANAYVQPIAGDHFAKIATGIRALGIDHDLHLMQSNGGITDVTQASGHPLRLLESGPAAGVLAACYWARQLGMPNLIAFDMGGTTAKICVIDNFQPTMARSFEIARRHRFKPGSGLTVRMPAIDLLEIGAGGGSIARVDELGLLKVGPTSAGAEPGPACYGLGGTDPTVTDADLLLGYLNPAEFLGGRMTLNSEAAERAIAAEIAPAFDASTVEAAAGVVRVVEDSMALATRIHATEQGKDPSDYTLFAFGGAGPLHACAIARILQMNTVIVPAAAGVFAASGLHLARPMVSLVQTRLLRLSDWEPETVADILAGLGARAADALRNFADETELLAEKAADVRFRGQGFEVEVVVPESLESAELERRFRQRYQALYGSLPPISEPEVVSWRYTAYAPVEQQEPQAPPSLSPASPATNSSRPIWFPESGFEMARAHRHRDLGPDQLIEGPAVVHQDESTVVIGPRDRARLDQFGNCLISLGNPV
jgi:N-methylhydantoinase A